jgi:hypothetical protein
MAIIKIRGGTAANWTSVNPVLAIREIGFETDTRKHKYGDGVTAWNSLPYAAGQTQYFVGTYASLVALQAAHPAGAAGEYGIVDAGIGTDASIYIWDDDDDDWVPGGASVTPDASTTVAGKVEKATTPEIEAGTSVGGSGAPLIMTPDQVNSRIDSKIRSSIGFSDMNMSGL